MSGIADTGFIVAFLNGNDRYHEWAVEFALVIRSPLITCDAVLAEAAFQTNSCDAVFDLIADDLLKVDFDFPANFVRLRQLAERYSDRQPDLADLCVICLSERYRKLSVVTVDSDFRIYRRFHRDRIPLVMPE